MRKSQGHGSIFIKTITVYTYVFELHYKRYQAVNSSYTREEEIFSVAAFFFLVSFFFLYHKRVLHL